MTAEAIVSLVLRKLIDLSVEEVRFLLGVRKDMDLVKIQLANLQAFLKDADDKKHKKDARVKTWLRQIRGISYDAEDIIDNLILRCAAERGLIKSCISIWNVPTIHKAGNQFQEIHLKINTLSSNKQTLEINVLDGGGGQEASSSSTRNLHRYRQDVAEFDELDMVGMAEDRMILKERLLDGDPKLRVIPIVGMGGSGKTTLAKQVSDDVENHFHCRAFIYVSQQHERRELWTGLIKSIMSLEAEEIKKLSDMELREKLRCHLKGRRYLVVIDDIWSKDAWDTFKYILPDGSNQSRVMLTTRNREVAAYADKLRSPPLEIRLLKDAEAWELFLRMTFPAENAPIVCPIGLEETGKKIFAKCHGLPLAVVLLGGLLSTKGKKSHPWSIVLGNVTKRLAESSDVELMKLMEILALSYYDLPCDFKPCFLYSGLFRPSLEDEISAKKLIRLWIAEGLIREDRAYECLEELINRSMIQVVTRRIDGSVRTCRIHDLLRDLSIAEAKENDFFAIHADNSTIEGLSSVRRLALYSDIEMNEAINCPIATLRSMLCFSDRAIDLSELLSRGVKFLRVLEIGVKTMPERKLPKNIGDFIHLRYLSLRGYERTDLPESIGKLSNLVTLELTFKATLPKEICKLDQLRHLYAYYCDIGGRPQLHKLKNLQTLCLSAGSWIKDGLGNLTNLRKLGIRGDLSPHQHALSDSIDKLCSLLSLKLVCGNSIPQNMSLAHHSSLYKMYLEGLMKKLIELPPNLAKLTLSKSELEQDAIGTLEKLPKLETLRLLAGSYRSGSMICSSGGFQQLEFLKLDCSNLKELIAEDDSMQSLKRVELVNNDNVRTPERVRDLSR